MAENEPAVHYERSESEKLIQKIKSQPFVPLGMAGSIAMLAWGGYSFRHRGEMSPSLFIMHLRIKTQSMIVGAITFGVAYSLLKEYIFDTHHNNDPSK